MKEDFEKYISKKAGQFEIVPEEELWTAIDAEINRKKKRRRFLFWLFFGTVMSGSLAWWATDVREKNTAVPSSQAVVEANSIPAEAAEINNATAETTSNSSEENIQNLENRTQHNYIYSERIEENKTSSNKFHQEKELQPASSVDSGPVTEETKEDQIQTGIVNEPGNTMEEIHEQDSVPVVEIKPEENKTEEFQEESKDSTVKDSTTSRAKWSVSAYVLMESGFYNYNEHTDLGSIASFRNNNMGNPFCVFPGIRLNYHISNSLAVGIGVELNSYLEKLGNLQPAYHNDTLMSGTSVANPQYDIVTSPAPALLDSLKPTSAKISAEYTFLSFPVSAQYYFLKSNKWNISFSAAAAYQVLISSDHYEYDFNEAKYVRYQKKEFGLLRESNLSFALGINAGYNLSKRIALFAGPVYQQSVYSFYNSTSLFDQYYKGAGGAFGVNYFFK